MPAKVIDGAALARAVRQECRARAAALTASGCTPGLAVLLVGSDPASGVYVRNKIRACAEVGVASRLHPFDGAVSEAEVLRCIGRLNQDPAVHG